MINQNITPTSNEDPQHNLQENPEKSSEQHPIKSVLGCIASILIFIGAIIECFDSSDTSDTPKNEKQTKEYISKNNNITYNFNELTPYYLLDYSDACKGEKYEDFGCVLRDLHKPGGVKKVKEKYDGKKIYIEKYIATDFMNGLDKVIFYDLEKMLPCHMTAEEVDRLGNATNNKKGMISIHGRLHVSVDSIYLSPCYFDKIYKCTEKESDGVFCLDKETNE